jgi:hypothetical protein
MFFLIPACVVRLPPHVITFSYDGIAFLLPCGIFWFLLHASLHTEELYIKAKPHAW